MTLPMTTPNDPDAPDLNFVQAERAAARSRAGGPWSTEHLRLCWAFLVPAGVVLLTVLALTAGSPAAIGAGIGIVIVGLFFTASTLFVAWVGANHPKMVMAAALGIYFVKFIALGAVIIAFPRDGAVSPRWMAIAVIIGMVAWLTAHLRYVWTAKVYYVDPD